MDFSDICYEIRTHSKMYNAMPKTSRMYFTIIFNRVMAKVIERQSKKTQKEIGTM